MSCQMCEGSSGFFVFEKSPRSLGRYVRPQGEAGCMYFSKTQHAGRGQQNQFYLFISNANVIHLAATRWYESKDPSLTQWTEWTKIMSIYS